MKRIAREVHQIDPADAIATKNEISHANGMDDWGWPDGRTSQESYFAISAHLS